MKKLKYRSPKLLLLGSMMQVTKGKKDYCFDKDNYAKHTKSNCTG